MKGFLLVDKESGQTSFDVVRSVKRSLNVRKVGHAGTLDPLATGLLVIAIGEGTKLLEYFIGCDKEYVVKAHFGYVSDSYDADGELSGQDVDAEFSREDVEKVIAGKFLGEIEQIPPKYSALKIDGKRACDRVRAGEEVEMKVRKIRVDAFEIENFDWPFVDFRIRCSTGTYIRSLVHDLGQALGCGAYVKELRRSVVGAFSVENAVEAVDKNCVQGLLALENVVVDWERIDLVNSEYAVLKNGGMISNLSLDFTPPLAAFFKDKLVGVLELHSSGNLKFRKQIMLQ